MNNNLNFGKNEKEINNKVPSESNIVYMCNDEKNKINKLADIKVHNIKDMKKKKKNIGDPNYSTRDLSWLKFNQRILSMAEDKNIPILERLKFLSITSSNLDEFSMVRVSKLLDKDEKTPDELSIMEITAKQEYKMLIESIHTFLDSQNKVLEDILIDLQSEGIILVKHKKELTKKGYKFIRKYFIDKIQSSLTPLVFDNTRPFPLITNNSLHIGVIIDNENGSIFGTIRLPDMDRVIEIKDDLPDGIREFILLEDIIKMNLDRIFINKKITKSCVYRVLRNFDYQVASESKVFIADEIKETLKRREVNDVIRLDISGNKKEFTEVLYDALHINKNCINKTNGIVDPTFGFSLANIKLSDMDKDKMRYPDFIPYKDTTIDEFNIFDRIDKDDIVLHHPYDSYDTVLKFIEQASEDPNVVAIKQTLYRVSSNSPIMKALIKAAENGKHVTVILEVKARFDEENNIHWANKLEASNGHVIYGVPDMKTHCKMCMVVRKNKKGILEKFVHVGTGNYNENNAKLYTDISLLTNKENITSDIEALFNYLTGFSEPIMRKVLYSPSTLQTQLIQFIDTEIKNAKENKPAKIVFKINGLTDREIIDKLYEAGRVGVSVILIVRSSCALVNTENVKVVSIVGRFLEHSRIYYFKNHGFKDSYYIGSADLMERNMYKRVEIAVPVNGIAKNKVKEILDIYLNDTTSFVLKDGDYKRLNTTDISCQNKFINIANENSNNKINNKIFSRIK